MSLIKPKRRRGPRMLWLILVPIFIVVALGLYVYLTMNGVNNSNEVKADTWIISSTWKSRVVVLITTC
jgi:hypothetical protein